MIEKLVFRSRFLNEFLHSAFQFGVVPKGVIRAQSNIYNRAFFAKIVDD